MSFFKPSTNIKSAKTIIKIGENGIFIAKTVFTPSTRIPRPISNSIKVNPILLMNLIKLINKIRTPANIAKEPAGKYSGKK